MYQAYNLTNESRELLLSKFEPYFENVVLHHITFKFGVPKNSPLPPDVSSVKVIGYAKNDDIECLICSIDGSTDRADGGTYHITISHSNNTSPKYSNDLISEGTIQHIDPISIDVVPAVNR